ncbi:MAG: DUF898 family protein [Sulfuritalea sp.]|nr:DUF898 family protein [Sulfuritalea sp.]
MSATTCYDILGVAADATQDEINVAYNQGLIKLRQSLASSHPMPAEDLTALQAAYKQASDPSISRSEPPQPPAGTNPAVTISHPVGRHGFAFTGNGGEYFRIWIVNLFLSIVTLGIYSAWAKVRRETWFHRHLILDDSPFSYHGKPIAILKGRLVAFGMLVALSVAQNVSALAYGLTILVLLPALPWLIVRAFRFRAHNTSYRGLRFSFHGSYRQALTAFLGYGILAGVSFGLLFPLFYRQQRKFVLDNLHYGNSHFQCDATAGQFYLVFLKPFALAIGVMVVAGVLAAIGGIRSALLPMAFVLFALGLSFVLAPYIHVRTTNLVWNSVSLGRMGFSSDLRLWPYIGLVFGNIILTLLTLGLFWPWAQVRLARYRADCMALLAAESLDVFVAGESAAAPAIGDELSDMMDMDIAL